MKKHSFTLIELLVVVGIIALLAGLVTPAVISAQRKGLVTQAKSDMHSIIMALNGVESTYGKMLSKSGSDYKFVDSTSYAPKTDSKTASGVEYKFAVFGPAKDAGDHSVSVSGASLDSAAEKAYDALICELSDPGNKIFDEAKKLNFNKRRQKFLDPKPDYDPSIELFSSDYDKSNADKMWLDPWGNRYVIMINTNFTDGLPNPADTGKILATKVAVISCGPNGNWDNAKNVDVNVGSPEKTADDIASWH